MSRPRRAHSSALSAVLASVLALGSGCQTTGSVANDYFDWGGRTFTTNPGSVAPYFLGFGAFFVAGLPLDLFSWIATMVGWSDGAGAEDYQGSALAPSMFLATSGGVLLGAPFFPFGLPWWNREEASTSKPASKSQPAAESPTASAGAPSSGNATSPPSAGDQSPPAGAPGR